jgi:uncharacterized membrane protein YedE/YeeE
MARLSPLLSPLLVGLIFGLGLCLSGMTDPAKVLGFLDLAGNWDPSLALVMGGAVAVAFVAFRIARSRSLSLTGAALKIPTTTTIDARLIGGAVLFGIGWGLAGLCPAPALVNLGFLHGQAAVFVLAMGLGMKLSGLAFGQKSAASD